MDDGFAIGRDASSYSAPTVAFGRQAQATSTSSVAVACDHRHRPYTWWERRLLRAASAAQRWLMTRRCPTA